MWIRIHTLTDQDLKTLFKITAYLFVSGFLGFNATHNSAYSFTRGKITKILGLGGRQTTILDELGISTGKPSVPVIEHTFRFVIRVPTHRKSDDLR